MFLLRLLLLASILGISGCAGQTGEQKGSSKAMKDDKTAVPCGPGDGNSATRAIDVFSSRKLSALDKEINQALDLARKAASGPRKWTADADGMAGATLDAKRYQLGGGTCASELERMATDAVGRGSNVEVRQASADRASIESALNAWVRSGPEETRAIGDIAEKAAASIDPALQTFIANGESATARNRGIAIVDPETREAIWLFGRAVRMTSDKRIPSK